MKEQLEVDIEIIRKRIIDLGDLLYGNLPHNMPPLQVLLSFFFLRRIDCMIGKYARQSSEFYQKNRDRYSEERMLSEMQSHFGGYPFYNFSGLNFDSILLSDKSIDIVVNHYIQGFSDNVQEIMEGLLLRNSIAILQRQSKFLEIVIRSFQEIDLSMSSVDDEEFVDLTYSLIDRMGGSFYRGGYMTPLPLAKLMSEILFQQMPPKKSCDYPISIYDPVCGTGCLLAYAYIKAISCHSHHHLVSLYGQDLNSYSGSIAKAMVLLLGNENSMIYHEDTLTSDMLPNNKFDFIIADMPFGQSWKHIKDKIVRGVISEDCRFIAGLPVVNDSQFLFIEHMVSKMTESGRVVFATTGSVLFNGSASSGESRIRRWLFENDLVECIISLPQGVLMPNTSIPIYLWVLAKNKEEQRKGKTLLINANETFVSKKGYKFISDEKIVQILHYYKNYTESHASHVLSNDQFGYYEISYSENGQKKTKTVKFGLHTDVDSYFETNVIPFSIGQISIDYTSVEKGYEIYFSKYFENKEKKISLNDISSKNILPLLDTFSSFYKDVERINKLELKTKDEINSNILSWKEYPLSYLAAVINGTSKPKEENGHGLPLLTISYLRDPNSEIEKYEWNKSDEKVVGEEDVLLASKGANVGEVFKGTNGIASSTLTIVRAQSNEILPKYLYYFLKGYEYELRGFSKGAGIQSLDNNALKNLKCNIPPIITQEKIIAFLERIDEKVELINNTLGNKDNVFSEYRQAIIDAAVNGKLKFT